MNRRGPLLQLGAPVPEYALVDRDRFVIGRVGICDLPLPSLSVSKRHAEIARHGEGWVVRDLRSTSGTRVNNLKLRAPHRLAVGATIQLGDQMLTVLALDHEAAPGELTGPIVRTARFECPAMTCVVQVDVTSSTGNAGAEHALGEALLGGVDRVERSRLIAADPVAVVAAVKALVDRSFAPIGGVAFRFTIRRVELDAHAIELLAEDTEPARAMWTWLWRDGRDLVSPHTAIVGVVAGRSSDDVEEPARALIDAALPSRGESLLVWLRRGTFGQLLRVGHGDRIERVVSRYSRARSSYDFARGWSVTAHGGDAPPETFELAPGTTVEIDTMRFTAL